MELTFLRQVWTLITKNLLIVVLRHPLATAIRAFILPLVITLFFSFAKNLFVPPAQFGIGEPRPVRTLAEGLAGTASVGRDTVAFVNSGFRGGAIDNVINTLVPVVEQAGKKALRLDAEVLLNTACRSSIRGVSSCYAGVVFRSSPDEGRGGIWNYTIRADGSLGGGTIDTTKGDNAAQLYTLPLQHAIDTTISVLGETPGNPILTNNTREYPFTSLTQQERADRIRSVYQASITNFLGVSFLIGFIGICYHLTGFMATEREIGMSDLIEAMMQTGHRWEAQAARLISYHLSFTVLYLPATVIGSLVLARNVWTTSNAGMIVVYHILMGEGLASMSILGAALFKKSQLSGVTVTIVYLLLGIVAQTLTAPKTATVAVLSLLFTPCNYVFFITYLARFEQGEAPTNLTQSAPGSPWKLSGIVLWVFLIIQILLYPILGALLERYLYGAGTAGRTILRGPNPETAENTVILDGFTKVYKPGPLRRLFGFISKPQDPVVAVDKLTFTARRGQILALLGANGSGKSTTLDAIAGTNRITSGNITIDGSGGLGIAPQKNVLWDELTVTEHIKIFNRLKSPRKTASFAEIQELIASVDLAPKTRAYSRTLSGGQKRKLQLGMMLTGGSAVCCVDEVSSGLDPLSRRKIWDILLANRGHITFILTTHFLDEADLLADHIAVLSKGTLRAQGSSVELKDRMGGGYRIHVPKTKAFADGPEIDGVIKKNLFDLISYIAPSSALAANVIKTLEQAGIPGYRFSGPTIEDVFLNLAEEVKAEVSSGAERGLANVPEADNTQEKKIAASEPVVVETGDRGELELLSGNRVGYLTQARVLFLKRCTILKRQWFLYLIAFVLPIAAAGLVTLFVKNQEPVGCSIQEQNSDNQAQDANATGGGLRFVLGPTSRINVQDAIRLFTPVFASVAGTGSSGNASLSSSPAASNGFLTSLVSNLTFVNTYEEFNTQVAAMRKNVTPGAFWLGDSSSPPTVAYRANFVDQVNALYAQSFLDMLLTNTSLAVTYAPFNVPWAPDTGKSLQLVVYVCLAFSAFPGFFALYPTLERIRNVRGLQFSNGVRALPMWMAYVVFDFIVILLSSALATILFATGSKVWYHVEYLFLIFMLYGLTSILIANLISLLARNQLSAYALTASSQAVMFLVYLIAYMSTLTFAPINRIDHDLIIVTFVIGAFAPIASVTRSLFLALNLFSSTCDGERTATNPGGILQYGGPIMLLVIQVVVLFLMLVWLGSGTVGSSWRKLIRRGRKEKPVEEAEISDEEVANELVRVTSSATETGSTDGLRVVHISKTFGKNTAVDNVTFGIKRGEVFALLGPNGAGKSTTISVIRGDIAPDFGGDVFVEGESVLQNLPAARKNLGVCPQFDAMDQMTVEEHLRFYARVRGIAEVNHNVEAVIRAVGLQAFRTRQAHALSGGNKRKLSLGIALMGNPSVLLLDEPSSGLDAAAKRIMWKTLAATVPGRQLLLTTHSMEEADALANRAGILARRMLAMGTTEQLRARFGNRIYVHIVCRGAPHTSDAEIAAIRAWIVRTFPGVEIEDKTYHGQMRFSIPPAAIRPEKWRGSTSGSGSGSGSGVDETDGESTEVDAGEASSTAQGVIGRLVVLLEEQKQALGIEHYSVSPTTLDQVFLSIVGKHNVREEGYEEPKKKSLWRKMLMMPAKS